MCLWHEEHAPDDLRGWLVRTVVHRSLHQTRSRERRRRHEESASRTRPELRGDDDPATILDRRDLAALVAGAIDALPPEFGLAFRLREIEGLEYDEIARRLGVPLGTVRSRLHRAKSLLRSSLAELVHDERWCHLCQRR